MKDEAKRESATAYRGHRSYFWKWLGCKHLFLVSPALWMAVEINDTR
jgi:hypothetical protein